jgi:hypothetical protein
MNQPSLSLPVPAMQQSLWISDLCCWVARARAPLSVKYALERQSMYRCVWQPGCASMLLPRCVNMRFLSW